MAEASELVASKAQRESFRFLAHTLHGALATDKNVRTRDGRGLTLLETLSLYEENQDEFHRVLKAPDQRRVLRIKAALRTALAGD